MISDCVAKYTNTTCAHMNNAKAQTLWYGMVMIYLTYK